MVYRWCVEAEGFGAHRHRINDDEAMNSYLFSLGNSYPGPIGYCFRVIAASPEEAVEKAKEITTDLQTVSIADSIQNDALETYFNIYINPEAITVGDIEMSETEAYPPTTED